MARDREPRLSRPALLILTALLERPTDELAGADIRTLTNVATGTLYPILLRLEEAGWLTSRWEAADPREIGRPRKRLYSLTALGATRAREATVLTTVPSGTLAWI